MKIDPLSTSISLVAIGIALTNFRNDWLAVVFVALALGTILLGRYLDHRQARLQKERRLKDLGGLNNLISNGSGVYGAFVKAGTDEEIAAAEGAYTAWLQECINAIVPVLGEGEAGGFAHLGALNSVSVMVQHPQKSNYRWGHKEEYLQRINIFKGRLAELMKKVP